MARQAREAKGRKPYNIASAEPGMRGADPSTVWRFEHAEGWPQSADHMIDLYAADLGIEPIELWARALELWREEEGGVTVAAAEGPPHAGVGGLADRLLGEADSPQSEESDSEQSGPAG